MKGKIKRESKGLKSTSENQVKQIAGLLEP